MIWQANSGRLIYVLCSTHRSSLRHPVSNLQRWKRKYSKDISVATRERDLARKQNERILLYNNFSSKPQSPTPRSHPGKISKPPEGCPPLRQVDECPPKLTKPVQPPPQFVGIPIISNSRAAKSTVSSTKPCEEAPGVSRGSQRTKDDSTLDVRQRDGGGEGGGDKLKWIAGLLALAFGGAVTYYYAFGNDDDSPKVVKDKKGDKGFQRLTPSKLKSPSTSDEIPKHVQYLLIGGGVASFSAFRSIKSVDPKAEVLLIGDEPEFPYMRPPLSKELWTSDRQMKDQLMFRQWNGSVRSVYFEPDSFYMEPKALSGSSKGGVAVARGWRVTQIDAINKQVTLDDGSVITYGKCLLAPGSKPKPFPLIEKAKPELKDKVFYFRSVFDFKDLADVTRGGKEVAIIGGGFLGSELACSLTHNGCSVTQIFRESGLLTKLLPKYLSTWLTEQVKNEGVQVLSDAEVTSVSTKDNRVIIKLSNGKQVESDYCVVATGAIPNTDLAENSNLETHPELGGYLVNAEMLARSNLYIAGDAACFYDERWGRRRVEHHDHAVVSGRLAGENMAGAVKPYKHVSMLWSDLSPDLGWEAVGNLDPALPTTGVFALEKAKEVKEGEEAVTEKEPTIPHETSATDGKEKFNKGVVFYQKDGVIVGILLWNVFNRMTLARQILSMGCKGEDMNEVAKLFKIHED